MSLNKIVLEALAKNPIGLKESLSEILSEKIAIALERKMEESTQLDEISGSTLGSYMVKAKKDMKKNRDAASDVMTNFMRRGGTSTKKDIDDAQSEYMKYDKKANNRNRGLSNAESKLKGSSFAKIHATEEVEDIQELSNKTLGNYIHKATISREKIQKARDDNREQRKKVAFHDRGLKDAIGYDDESHKIHLARQAVDDATRDHLDKKDKQLSNKAWNRDRGVYTAINKLGK